MSDLEDTVAESQIKLKTVDKYKFKIAELTKELRAYLDQVTTKWWRVVFVLIKASWCEQVKNDACCFIHYFWNTRNFQMTKFLYSIVHP